MTNEEQLESGQEVVEAQEQPSPAVPSVPSGVEQASAPSLDLDNLAEKVAGMVRAGLQEDVERQFQSTKDRRYASVEKIAAYLDTHGGDVEKATREMKMDELLARDSDSPSSVPGRTEEEIRAEIAATFEATSKEILSGANIPFDDAEYNALVKEYADRIRNPEHWRTVVQALADRRRIQSERQEGVTPAASSSALGGTPPSGGDTDDELLEKIEVLLKHPLQNIEERKGLIAEAKKRELMK